MPLFFNYVLIALLIVFKAGLSKEGVLPGFKTSPYYNEQVVTFNLPYDIRVHINAPAAADFNAEKPAGLVLYALPNGNTIEQTAGKVLKEGDDWHYNIQHIAAQTRFLRTKVDYNLVVVYLEASTKSWPAWKRNHPQDHADIIKKVTEYLLSVFDAYQPFVVLNGHSGGGRFVFSYLDAHPHIPDYVQRIVFLDSNYGYEEPYGRKISQWLSSGRNRFLNVFAYNDSIALYKGKPFVSSTGGTWYRSKMMQRDLAGDFTFTTQESDSFVNHTALDGRLRIYLKKNPLRKILHTVQVERNGFIHSILAGSKNENDGYGYYNQRCYDSYIQQQQLTQRHINIPLRSALARSGSQFMHDVENMSFEEREAAILEECISGNIPYFLRDLKTLKARFFDADSQAHAIEYRVFPDYLAIGSDSDYCRVPMGPVTAQKIASFYNTSLPTRKLVNHIYEQAEIKVAPVSYWPVGNENEKVYKFVRHSTTIDSQLQAAGGKPGQLLAGIKKDVVLSNRISDPQRTHHVTIYGWHRLNGIRIQPLTNVHIDIYVDYSHGIRLIDDRIKIDGHFEDIKTILQDSVMYNIISDESGPMRQPTYIK